jgi:ketosteroid isomerase-like protein
VNRISCVAAALIASAAPLYAGQPAVDEKEVWSLEDTYWGYVKANDLEHYRTLWHRDFLGWPLSSPEPVRKDHITDWITAHTSIGETLKSADIERLEAQATGAYVTVTYRARLTWVAKDGAAKPGGLRVIHTWIRNSDGKWQIISGMAASPNANGH